MNKLDVIELAKKVSQESTSGAITAELLRKGNDLYEPSQTSCKLRRISANGEVAEGTFQDGRFKVDPKSTIQVKSY